MPKVSKKAEKSSSDSDSGPDDVTPAKKPKSDSKKGKEDSKKGTEDSKKGTEEENSWALGKHRFVKLTEFKNNWYVNIREYYQGDDGDLKPGKKGIMLTMEQWQKFKGCLSEIDEAIKQNV